MSREKFEALPEIAAILAFSDFKFNEDLNQYWHPDHVNHRLNLAFLMGAYYAFCEQEKRIEEIKSKVQDIWTELDDRQSKEYIIEQCEKIIQEILK